MTDTELERDSMDSYTLAIAALRMRALLAGDATPREQEPVDLMLLRAIAKDDAR